MGQISEYIILSTTVRSAGVARAGFGIALIPSWTAAWAERYRRYTSIDAVAVDFAVTTPEYLEAAAYFAQDPRPQVVGIGRCALPPTQKRTITPTVVNSTVYSLYVRGLLATYTSDASATDAEIVTGLIAAVNALAGDTLTATGTTTLILTANAPGNEDDVYIVDPTLLSLAQDHVDPGIGTDLTAIKNENAEWYGVITRQASELMIKAVDTWVLANKRVQIVATQDTKAAVDAVGLPATDVMFDLKTSATKRTAVLYHPKDGERSHAAWTGVIFAQTPGKATPAYKTLIGVDSVVMTDTHRANILAKNASYYDAVQGVNITFEGKSGHGQFIDITRNLDWVDSEIGIEIFNGLLAADKIDYSDAGIRVVAGLLRAALDRAVAAGVLLSYDVEVPTRASQSASDITARRLKNLKWSGIGAGAIHGVTILGDVTF